MVIMPVTESEFNDASEVVLQYIWEQMKTQIDMVYGSQCVKLVWMYVDYDLTYYPFDVDGCVISTISQLEDQHSASLLNYYNTNVWYRSKSTFDRDDFSDIP